MSASVAVPHSYLYVEGHWICPVCRVFIKNADCSVNREFVVATAEAGESRGCALCEHRPEDHDEPGRCDVDAGIPRVFVRCHGDEEAP